MITLRTVLRGTLTRFLPALLLGTAVMYTVASMLDRITVGWPVLGTVYAWLTLGYSGALAAMRYGLRADAGIAGRRSVVAGFLAPAAYMAATVLLVPLLDHNRAGLAVGALLALGMFFPWIKSMPVARLTDLEVRQLLDEGRDGIPGFGSTPVAQYAEKRRQE